MSKVIKEPFGTLGHEIKRDVHRKDLDAKIIITSHNSRPGLGKTTLAIKMARDFDAHGWSAREKAFMDAAKYHNAYEEHEPGSVLLFDEIEGEADSRRSMSNKNVELSQAWAQNRYRNMITICTLPSVSMLDNRMLEMSDYWINVIDRGQAHPYRVLVNDFTGAVIRQRIDDDGVIWYDDLPEGDDDYGYLKQMKHSRRMGYEDGKYLNHEEHKEKLEKAVEKARMEVRNQWITELYDNTDLSTYKIAELGCVDVSRRRVSDIASES